MNTADIKAYEIMKNNSCRTMYSAERDRNVGLVFVCACGFFFFAVKEPVIKIRYMATGLVLLPSVRVLGTGTGAGAHTPLSPQAQVCPADTAARGTPAGHQPHQL